MKHFEKSIMEELSKRGIEVGLEEIAVTKNDVRCTGVKVIDLQHPAISPIVYYSEGETVAEIANRIMMALLEDDPEVNLHFLEQPEYFAEHLILGVSKRGGEEEDIVRVPFLNLDLILRVRLDDKQTRGETMSAKVTHKMLEAVGIPVEEAFAIAKVNSLKTANFRKLSEIIRDMGMPVADDDCEMYVATCNDGRDGAAVICMTDQFRAFCERKGYDSLYILPSSTQELILLPKTDQFCVDDLVCLVDEINRNEVEDILQLEPAVYVYTCSDNGMTVVRSHEREVLA